MIIMSYSILMDYWKCGHMDYRKYLELVDEEIDYFSALDVTFEPEQCKAMGALYVLHESTFRRN